MRLSGATVSVRMAGRAEGADYGHGDHGEDGDCNWEWDLISRQYAAIQTFVAKEEAIRKVQEQVRARNSSPFKSFQHTCLFFY